MRTASTPTQVEMIKVFQIALRNCSLVKTSRYRLSVMPLSPHKLARKIAPSGNSIKKTSSSAAPIHSGKVGSLNRSKDQPVWPARSSVEVCEAGMDLAARGLRKKFHRVRCALSPCSDVRSLEWWSTGVLEHWVSDPEFFNRTHHSNTALLQHSISPLRPKEFHEALFYFGIAPFKLVGIRRQQFQILELGLVRRIGDVRMAGIKTFFIR